MRQLMVINNVVYSVRIPLTWAKHPVKALSKKHESFPYGKSNSMWDGILTVRTIFLPISKIKEQSPPPPPSLSKYKL